ncbi:Actin-binding Rho-activating protein [Bagarius yarrelli]|uniref:Actin-binding Rho-activating protein n=1 Tax=Bagarius yarrelli TaxID=175774 RepID=A0A556V896_BAGYA|nr:Actin-binding Rho-activating protein [Bagarius yarrelli]
MTSMTTQDCQENNRTIKKIKVANTMTKSWPKVPISKQGAVSSAQLSDYILEEEKKMEPGKSKFLVPPVFPVSDQVTGDGKAGMVKKNMSPKHCDGNHDLESSIKEKVHPVPEETKDVSKASFNRKYHCEGTEVGQSCFEKNVSISKNNNQTEVKKDQPFNRPKIKVTTMGDLRSKWQKFAEEHVEGQKLNPFSEDFDYNHAMTLRLHKGQAGYGHPKDGSKTAQRAERAQKHIHREMDEMCYIIRNMGQMDQEGYIYVSFGRLFQHYVKISDKVVGILLRCRKHKMVDFEGEMLWQGQHDDVKIRLLV